MGGVANHSGTGQSLHRDESSQAPTTKKNGLTHIRCHVLPLMRFAKAMQAIALCL